MKHDPAPSEKPEGGTEKPDLDEFDEDATVTLDGRRERKPKPRDDRRMRRKKVRR